MAHRTTAFEPERATVFAELIYVCIFRGSARFYSR
jgi:hypothetical protein